MLNFLWDAPRGCVQCKHSVFSWRYTQKCFEEVPTAPAAPCWEYFVLFPADPSIISVNICSEEQQTKFWKTVKTLFKIMVNIQGMFSWVTICCLLAASFYFSVWIWIQILYLRNTRSTDCSIWILCKWKKYLTHSMHPLCSTLHKRS